MASIVDPALIENLLLQQQEIEMLKAMFPGEKEVVWDDPSLPIDVEEFINSSGRTPHYLRFLSFTVNLEVSSSDSDTNIDLRLSLSLPTAYPRVHPTISVISNQLNRSKLSELNKDLLEYMANLDCGEMILLSLIGWLQENVNSYSDVIYSLKDSSNLETVEIKEENICMWLYMHHIYNKEKRKDIIHWADELSLTGFSLPGKPGVVYVEGTSRNVDEYFDRLRRLSWKRMSCKVKEKCDKRIFENFKEICFDVHGGRDYHMDMGKFFSFLKENGLGHIFKELFGVEGHG